MKMHLNPSNQQPNYRYTIDKSTGNLLIIQDVNILRKDVALETNDFVSVSISTPIGLSGDALTLNVAESQTQTGQITFHSAENINSDNGGNLSQLQEDKSSTNQNQAQHLNVIPIRRAMWSKKKISDFIKCIINHESRFQKSSKTKTNIWNDISADMLKIGHRDCNKDECNKKWNNLYRTWKKVKLRPKEDRQKWQYYQSVTSLVKSIYRRGNDKVSTKKSLKLSTQELILKMLEQNHIHQQRIDEEVSKFQNKIQLLENERDVVLFEIKKNLQNVKPQNDD